MPEPVADSLGRAAQRRESVCRRKRRDCSVSIHPGAPAPAQVSDLGRLRPGGWDPRSPRLQAKKAVLTVSPIHSLGRLNALRAARMEQGVGLATRSGRRAQVSHIRTKPTPRCVRGERNAHTLACPRARPGPSAAWPAGTQGRDTRRPQTLFPGKALCWATAASPRPAVHGGALQRTAPRKAWDARAPPPKLVPDGRRQRVGGRPRHLRCGFRLRPPPAEDRGCTGGPAREKGTWRAASPVPQALPAGRARAPPPPGPASWGAQQPPVPASAPAVAPRAGPSVTAGCAPSHSRSRAAPTAQPPARDCPERRRAAAARAPGSLSPLVTQPGGPCVQ